MTTADDPIYLDHNATTPVLPEVVEQMLPYLREHFGNPSSTHAYGRRAAEAVERARRQLADLIGADPDEIVFTSGGTESNNLAIRGAAGAADGTGQLVTSVIEHPAVRQPCDRLDDHGWKVNHVPVDRDGCVELAAFDEMLTAATELVTIMLANNETGVVQPVGKCADRAREEGAVVHTDAAQAVGKIEVDVDELGVDLLTVAGHKMYAPKGVGALYVRSGTLLEPLLEGAGHERGLRPGTENVASIVGLGAAAELAGRTLDEEARRVGRLRDQLFERLDEAVPKLGLNGHRQQRLPNTLNVRFPDVRGDQLLAATEAVAASGGSACQNECHKVSPTIAALGIPRKEALGSVRLSLGRGTTEEDVERAAEALVQSWREVSS